MGDKIQKLESDVKQIDKDHEALAKRISKLEGSDPDAQLKDLEGRLNNLENLCTNIMPLMKKIQALEKKL